MTNDDLDRYVRKTRDYLDSERGRTRMRWVQDTLGYTLWQAVAGAVAVATGLRKPESIEAVTEAIVGPR